MDPSVSFHRKCNYIADMINKRSNIVKTLAGSSWRQEKETVQLLTYNVLGKSIASYTSQIWSTNPSDSSFKKILTAQNTDLRTANKCDVWFYVVQRRHSGDGCFSASILFRYGRGMGNLFILSWARLTTPTIDRVVSVSCTLCVDCNCVLIVIVC